MEDNCSHGDPCIGVSYELSVIFSNIEDEAWSQYKHLYERENLENTAISPSTHVSWVL